MEPFDQLEALFITPWNKMMERLVNGDFVKLLNQRNIEVDQLSQSTSGVWNGEPYEFDMMACNRGGEIVLAWVSTTLNIACVDEFVENLSHFKEMTASYRDKKVYGAVAYLEVDEYADVYAERAGLFVIRAADNPASLLNSQSFVPKNFGWGPSQKKA